MRRLALATPAPARPAAAAGQRDRAGLAIAVLRLARLCVAAVAPGREHEHDGCAVGHWGIRAVFGVVGDRITRVPVNPTVGPSYFLSSDRIGLNYVYMEPADATIVRSDRFADVTLGTQAILFVYPLHFGRFGGRVNPAVFYGVMVVYVVIGIAPFVLMVTGLLIYWNRSLSKKRKRAIAPRRPEGVPVPSLEA